jgi:hypothetical protein
MIYMTNLELMFDEIGPHIDLIFMGVMLFNMIFVIYLDRGTLGDCLILHLTSRLSYYIFFLFFNI